MQSRAYFKPSFQQLLLSYLDLLYLYQDILGQNGIQIFDRAQIIEGKYSAIKTAEIFHKVFDFGVLEVIQKYSPPLIEC